MISTNLLALALMAALNPLVARAPEPRGIIPADCTVSDAPPMTRITAAAVEDSPVDDSPVPRPRVPAARPTNVASNSSAANMADLQRALAVNDRPAFDAALTRAKAAGESTRVYEDVARLWDAQFQSPFFVEDSDAYRVASSYPGYQEAVRRQIFTDAHGRKFYPAAESRAFVATHAGIRSPAPRPATTTRGASSTPPTTPRVTSPVTTVSPTQSTTTGRRNSGKTSSRPASRKPAASRTRASSSSSDPVAAPKMAAREPAPVVAAVVETPSTEAPSAARPSGATEPVPSIDTVANESVVTETTATGPAATDTTATDTTATATDTTTTAVASGTATSVPDTTTNVAVPAPKGRSILIPAILILIGLGVLILLFRTQA